MDARRAHGYHGSREHGNERNAGGLAAGSSGLARAQAMLTGETYSCSQRNDGKASVARRRCARSASFVKDRKELITDHFCQEKIKRRARARSDCAGSTNCGTSLACKRTQACSVLCALCRCRPEGQSPDLTSSKHREVPLTRSATRARDAGKRLRRAADPSDGARPRGGGQALFGTGASGRGAPARDRWGRREQRERDRGARAVQSQRMPHAMPTRLRQLELEGDGPRHGLSLPASRPDAWGLGRSSPGAFGRTKNKSLARPAHRARDEARAPRGRRAVRQICVFEALATQDWRPLVRTDASTE